MMSASSFINFMEEKMGGIPFLLIYVVLEWGMIILLFIDGLIALFSNEFAKLFELRIPCLLCTRIDHLLVRRNANFYYNDSMCELHKKQISALAYCHLHKKLSDIRIMCQGCLLSFATGKEYSNCDKYNSLVAVNVDGYVEEERKLLMKPVKHDDAEISGNTNNRCFCCGEALKSNPSLKYARSSSSSNASPRASWLVTRVKAEAAMASPRASTSPRAASWLAIKNHEATASPRASWLLNKNEVDLPPIKFKPLKFTAPDDMSNAEKQTCRQDLTIDVSEDANRTPSFARGNSGRFFGISLDPMQMSPKWVSRVSRKSFRGEPKELECELLNNLKRQVGLDHKSLMALYMELDKERSAAAVAANNAMAMITRLQAEKAAVQMEALQYQRMMDEQAEYDEEAIQMLRDMLLKREEDIKSLETELEMYREKYGYIKREDSEVCEVDVDDDYQEMRSQPSPSFSGGEKPESCSLYGADLNERNQEEASLDFANERSYLLGLVTSLEKKLTMDDGFNSPNREDKRTGTKPLTREMSIIKERLRVVEADSGFLKHVAMTMHRGDEGMKLLAEIAEHLRNLRHLVESGSENTDA